MRDHGGELRVLLPQTTARRIFEVTALDQVLSAYDSVEGALAG
jgi:anti-anti-sigma regulatory factor